MVCVRGGDADEPELGGADELGKVALGGLGGLAVTGVPPDVHAAAMPTRTMSAAMTTARRL
jgi:hypothetical protein